MRIRNTAFCYALLAAILLGGQPSVGMADQATKEKFASYLDKIEMVAIPENCFDMGSKSENASPEEIPVHEVCLDAYSIGKYEVTQGLWQAVMGENPSARQLGPDHPVENISWNDTQKFLKELNAKTGKKYRLPTEAEWEYACRSGNHEQRYCGSGDVDDLAWTERNSNNITHEAGAKMPNDLGIYDMTGNVWEWCQDWFGMEYYKNSPRNNPTGPETSDGGPNRVNRGGSFDFPPIDAATRGYDDPKNHNNFVGMRLVLPGK